MAPSKRNECVALCEEECINTTQISGLEMCTVLLPEWRWDSSFGTGQFRVQILAAARESPLL